MSDGVITKQACRDESTVSMFYINTYVYFFCNVKVYISQKELITIYYATQVLHFSII